MIFGFLLSTIFIPDISGAATAPRWALAGVLLPILLMSASREAHSADGSGFSRDVARMAGQENKGSTPAVPHSRGFTAVHLFGLAFIWYAAISLSWTAQVYDGLDALIKLVIIAEAFVYGSNLGSLRPVIIGFGLGVWVSSLVILTGLDVPRVTDNAGLFANSNSMGEIAGLVLVAVMFYREPNLEKDSIVH